jgi:hypothetical protein
MKNEKIKLEDLKLKSFVTVLDENEKSTAKGGGRWNSLWQNSGGRVKFYTILETRLSPKNQLPPFLSKFDLE